MDLDHRARNVLGILVLATIACAGSLGAFAAEVDAASSTPPVNLVKFEVKDETGQLLAKITVREGARGTVIFGDSDPPVAYGFTPHVVDPETGLVRIDVSDVVALGTKDEKATPLYAMAIAVDESALTRPDERIGGSVQLDLVELRLAMK